MVKKSKLTKILKGQPKIVGVVLILIGVMFFLSLISYNGVFTTDYPILKIGFFSIFGVFALSLGFTIFYQGKKG